MPRSPHIESQDPAADRALIRMNSRRGLQSRSAADAWIIRRKGSDARIVATYVHSHPCGSVQRRLAADQSCRTAFAAHCSKLHRIAQHIEDLESASRECVEKALRL